MSAIGVSIVCENSGDPTKPCRCSFDSGRLTPCWPLEEALEGPYGRGTRQQGLKLASMFRTKPRYEFSRHAVRLVSGKFSGNGVEITACPFCLSLLDPDNEQDYTVIVSEAAEAAEPPTPPTFGDGQSPL